MLGALALFLLLRPYSHAQPPPIVRAKTVAAQPERRASAPRWGQGSRAQVDAALHAALAPALAGARAWSCVAIAQDGSILYDDRDSAAVTPASVAKLIVADAALTQLGPQYSYETLLASTRLPRDGALDGDLWLGGSGDPSLRTEDLQRAVRALAAAGLKRIDGRVIVDGSALSGEEINPYWDADDGNEDFMAAVSGISLDEDTVEFRVTGTTPALPAQVQIWPQSPRVRYYGQVTTGGGDDVIVAATQTPNEFRLDGNIPPGIEEKFWVPVHGIPQYVGSVANTLLQRGGVAVTQTPSTGTMPLDAQILWQHRSKPLPQLLQHMLVFSDNHFAEQLMRTLGAASGDVGTDGEGLSAEKHVLAVQAIPTPGLRLLDGSGLARGDRVAALTLGRVLSRFDADPHGNALYPLLPRGGMDGTLKMYHFQAASGRVRAKSGHLEDAASLAGYVDTRRHGRVVFAFMINGSPGDPDAAIVAAVDSLAER